MQIGKAGARLADLVKGVQIRSLGCGTIVTGRMKDLSRDDQSDFKGMEPWFRTKLTEMSAVRPIFRGYNGD